MPNKKPIEIPLVEEEDIEPSEEKPEPISTTIPEIERPEIELSTTLGDPCCDKVCKDLNKEINYRTLSIGKTYIKRFPIPRVTTKLIKKEKGENSHPSPTIEEFEYASTTFDVEALVDLRNSLDKNVCKCSKLYSEPTEDEMREMLLSTRDLTTFSPLFLRQIYKGDRPIPSSQLPSSQTQPNSDCCTNICHTLNSQIGKLEKTLNDQELEFKNRPLARYSSPTYTPNIFRSHALKQYRNNLKRKRVCNCIE